MRLANAAHAAQPWRIHGLAPDFRLEDVWALRTPGGPDDLPRLVRLLSSGDGTEVDPQGRFVGGGSGDVVSRVSRALFSLRWKLGEALGWDRPALGVGARVRTLRDRLPADLREAAPGPDLRPAVPFTSVYLIHDEWAAEIANRTVHAVMHIGWVPDGTGGHRGQMAVLVKPNGLLGQAYMAAIRPFRRFIVDPALIRMIERQWAASGAAAGSGRPA
jgi:hypothetical protein